MRQCRDTKFFFKGFKCFASEHSEQDKWSIFQHEKRNFRSSSGHAMFYCISTPMKYQTNHLDIFFARKGAIYYVTIATVNCSCVKIICFFYM